MVFCNFFNALLRIVVFINQIIFQKSVYCNRTYALLGIIFFDKPLDKQQRFYYTSQFLVSPVAQLDRVSGYEPEGRAFESLRVRQVTECAHRLAVRISPFHGGNGGSIPPGRAKILIEVATDLLFFHI